MNEAPDNAVDYRIILLGASNLTLGLPRLVSSLCSSLPGKVEVLAAAGHGRSYLNWSYVIYRGLPGIQDCSLWQAVENRPPAKQTLAMVTDLGCDLFYGAQPLQIVDAVAVCLSRLKEMGATTVFARPPLTALNKIGSTQYYIVKNIFFPGPTIRWSTMRRYINDVDAGVLEIANGLEVFSVFPQREWYGYDPIHIKRKCRSSAWSEILAPWGLDQMPSITAPGLRQSLSIWTGKAAERRVWRVPGTHSQPVREWSDGSSLSLY